MAETRHKSPRTAMRYANSATWAVAEVTSLLGLAGAITEPPATLRLAVASGVPGLVVVADLLGHARLDTVRACTRPTEDDRTKTLNLLPADR